MRKSSFFSKYVGLILLLIPYILFIVYIIDSNRGPVDYETFMNIGHRFLTDKRNVYGENSYYPLPHVMIFAFFSMLPRPISMAVWMLFPVFCALWITRGNPIVLLFAPLFGHFVGGQSSGAGMLGFWGYRERISANDSLGGIFLALTLLKPQLGVIPLIYALIQWWKSFTATKHIPRQAWAFLLTMILMFLPSFFLFPDWVIYWLKSPRPLFERAISGFFPRTLLYFFSPQSIVYWLILAASSGLLFMVIWIINHKKMTLDLAMLWGFITSPLMHDYDLIQLIPLLNNARLSLLAVVFSLPTWLVILFAYNNDAAWYVCTLIAPGILLANLLSQRWSAAVKSEVVCSDVSS